MQTVLNYITIITFISNAIMWSVLLFARSVRISIDVLDYRTYNHSCKIYVRITNKSFLPIIINSFSIIEGNKEYMCYLQPVLSRNAYGKQFFTADFPVNLSSCQGAQCYVEFRHFLNDEPIQLTEGKNLVLQIHTNRGPIKRDVTLGKKSYYLRSRL